jgi:hypothetical protein
MKSWAFAAIFVSVAAAAACSDSGSGGSGGSGGETSTSSSTGSSSSSSMMSSSASTAGACDDLAVCGDAADPASCLGCALGGDCADELATCQGDQECIDFVTCIDPCADQACFDACVTMYPNGATLYNDLVFCAICEQCPISCDGPGSGCP